MLSDTCLVMLKDDVCSGYVIECCLCMIQVLDSYLQWQKKYPCSHANLVSLVILDKPSCNANFMPICSVYAILVRCQFML